MQGMQSAWFRSLLLMLTQALGSRVTLHADTSGIPGTLLAAVGLRKKSLEHSFGQGFLPCHAFARICAILCKLALGWKSFDRGHLGRAQKVNPQNCKNPHARYLSGDACAVPDSFKQPH